MSLILTNNTLSLRPINDNDLATLSAIYASTRQEEIDIVWNWSEVQKHAFLQQQFSAQHVYYQNNYQGANFWMITENNRAIGRLYLHKNYQNHSVRIIDISILPAWRNKGIGVSILTDITNHAAQLDRSVTIHVETFNPAMKLYKRLGFKVIDEKNGVYHLLEWKASTPAIA